MSEAEIERLIRNRIAQLRYEASKPRRYNVHTSTPTKENTHAPSKTPIL
jgi:hypothetical protein